MHNYYQPTRSNAEKVEHRCRHHLTIVNSRQLNSDSFAKVIIHHYCQQFLYRRRNVQPVFRRKSSESALKHL